MRRAFVSSTFVDLEKHRRYVIDALQDAGLAVDPMERWTAASDEPKQLSQDRVRGCDLCVLLVARRRGHIPQGETLSVTQLEVHAAVKLGLDVLVFMLDDDAFWKTEWDERASDPELMRWRAELQERYTTSYFNHEASSVEVGPAISRWFDKLSRTTEPGGTSEPAAASGTFVGRQHALTALKRLVTEEQERGSQRPIALVGMGGVGKTTLARELMRRLVDGYPGGELVLERPPGGHPKAAREVFSEWASRMGQPPEREYTATEIRHLLARSRGATLCLIDDAAKSDIAELKIINQALPASWPRLVTTRQKAVGTALGARIYPVRNMNEDEALELIEERLHSSLDEDAAGGAAGVTMAIQQHRAALTEFIERVDGLPLALRLGIGACDSLAEIPGVVQTLVDSLERGIKEFEDEAMAAAESNESLAATLSASLRDLERADQMRGADLADRFRALGVLPDGCTYDRAFLLAVWGDPPTDGVGGKALRTLVSNSMVDKNADTGAYKIHPVLRAFASESLVKNTRLLKATRQRYHRIVVNRAKQSYDASPERWTAPDDLYAHLARVLPTLSQTLEQHATPTDHDPTAFTTLAAPVTEDRDPYTMLRDRAYDDVRLGTDLAETFKQAVNRSKWGPVGTQLLKLGLVCARADNDQVREAEYLGRLGTQHSTRRPERAEAYFAAATRLARDTDASSLGMILTRYAEFRRTVADSESALALAEEALSVHAEVGDERLVAQTRTVLGEIFWRLSRLDEAQAEYVQARMFLERSNDVQGLADLLNKLASVEFNRGGRYELAIELFEEALARHEALQDDVMRAEDLNDLGACYRYLDRYEEAERCFKEALELNEKIGNRRLQAMNICNIAGALYGQGQYDLAQQHAEQGRALGEEVRDKVPQLWGLVWEGLAWQGMDEPARAERLLREAVALGRSFDNPRDLAGALARLGSLLADGLGRPDEGLAMIDEAITLLRSYDLVTAFSNVTLADLEAQHDALAAARGVA